MQWIWVTNELQVYPLLDLPNYMWETGSGGQEQNGTYDMNGNSWDWCESAYDGVLDDMGEDRVIRGGGYYEWMVYLLASHDHGPQPPTKKHQEIGVRIVFIPSSRYWLDLSVAGSGSVSLSNGWYAIGTNLSLVATPDTNWLFMGWSGDLTGDYTMASTNLLMDADKAITVMFSDNADSDGLLNSTEDGLGTDPRNSDTDDDGLLDGAEVMLHATDPLDSDSDDDGLSDGDEINTYSSDPLQADSDSDGLLDGAEVLSYWTDPLTADTDGDGLSDGSEVTTSGTDPLDSDSDSDTFNDGMEVSNGGDPLVSDLWRVDYIRNNGNLYDLYSSNSVVDISLGQAVFVVTNGEATLVLQLEQSNDLVTWTNAGNEVIWTIPVDSNKAFYRVRSQN